MGGQSVQRVSFGGEAAASVLGQQRGAHGEGGQGQRGRSRPPAAGGALAPLLRLRLRSRNLRCGPSAGAGRTKRLSLLTLFYLRNPRLLRYNAVSRPSMSL